MMTKLSKTTWKNLPDDPDHVVPLIKKFVRERKGTWDKVICLGMGGSALGIVTLQKALFPFDDRLTVLDNLDSISVNHQLSILNPSRTLVLVISKSGTTLETMTLLEIFKKKFSKKDYQKNFIAITDPNEGRLRKIADRDGLTSFSIPSEVGGRFSVLSAVGLLPLALLGGSPEKLLKGAKHADNKFAKKLAQKTFDLYQQGVIINAMMIYSDHLYPFSLWYQQLLAESIGKSRTVGITPLALRGTSDQHSVLQLLQDGPNDKFTIFLSVTFPPATCPPWRKGGQGGVHKILNLECQATEQALREDGRPTTKITIDKISEESLGMLFMLFQMQVIRLGELFHVNAFDQPGVEKSKEIVKKLLS